MAAYPLCGDSARPAALARWLGCYLEVVVAAVDVIMLLMMVLLLFRN